MQLTPTCTHTMQPSPIYPCVTPQPYRALYLEPHTAMKFPPSTAIYHIRVWPPTPAIPHPMEIRPAIIMPEWRVWGGPRSSPLFDPILISNYDSGLNHQLQAAHSTLPHPLCKGLEGLYSCRDKITQFLFAVWPAFENLFLTFSLSSWNFWTLFLI